MALRTGSRALPPGFRVIWATVAVDLIGFGIVIPLLPQYAATFDATPTTIGLLVASFSLAQLVMAPVMGRLSDRIGRKPVLLVSLFGSALGSLLTGLAGSIVVLFAGRILDGASGASVSVAQASAADLAAPEDRARLMGFLGAAFGVGFVAGPAIGSLGALGGPHIPFFIAAAISFVNALVAIFRLPETHPDRSVDAASREGEQVAAATSPDGPGLAEPGHLGRTKVASAVAPAAGASASAGAGASAAPASSGSGAVDVGGVRRLIALAFVGMIAFSGFEATFALLGEVRLGFTLATTAAVFTAIGIALVGVQVGLVGPATQRFGERGTLRVGLVSNAAGLLVLSADFGWPGLIVALGFLVVGQGLLTPTLSSALAGRAGAARGRWLGWQQSAGGLARVVGPVSAGALFEHASVGAPYLLGAGLMLVALLLVPRAATAP